ncbi:MAG TPA: low molecular weight protein arginine phosphatase [Gemmatimonadaceae bacterium]|nr:low molecular weight protein arginine phosphatase [Gemmatimonadaceae bacterium]
MRILFVCTGNTCRSAMAEAIARRIARERGMTDIEVGSAGTAAWEDAPASDGALLVCMERDTDLSSHHARLATRELLDQYDLVLAMGPHHVERLEALGGKGKTYLLTTYASRGAVDRPIGDPFGGELELYRETFVELERELQRLFDRIAAERTPGVS